MLCMLMPCCMGTAMLSAAGKCGQVPPVRRLVEQPCARRLFAGLLRGRVLRGPNRLRLLLCRAIRRSELRLVRRGLQAQQRQVSHRRVGQACHRCDMARCVATCCTAPRQCCTALQHVALRCDVARCVAARCGAATCLASAALGSLGQCEAGFFGRACCGDIKTCAYCSTGPERYAPDG